MVANRQPAGVHWGGGGGGIVGRMMLSWFYDVTQRRNVNDFLVAVERRSNEQWALEVVPLWVVVTLNGGRVYISALCNNRIRFKQKEMYTIRVVSCI